MTAAGGDDLWLTGSELPELLRVRFSHGGFLSLCYVDIQPSSRGFQGSLTVFLPHLWHQVLQSIPLLFSLNPLMSLGHVWSPPLYTVA